MATVTEILNAIDQKTNTFATTISNVRSKIDEVVVDLGEIKTIIQQLKDSQNDQALADRAQTILDKFSNVDSSLSDVAGKLDTVETDLENTGKGGSV